MAGHLDLVGGEVVRHGVSTSLTSRELALLRYLADHAERAVSREELLREVWAYRARYRTRAVEQTVTRLRKKLEDDAAAPRHLVTVHGRGYRLLAATGADDDDGLLQWIGASGVGKSTRARRWADGHGAAWVSLAGVQGVVGLRRRLAEALRVTDEAPDALSRALGEAGYVVFDQAEDLDPGAVAALEAVVSESGGVARVTTQVPLSLPGRRVVMRGLPVDEARSLVHERRRSLGLEAAATEVVDAAIDAVGGHPLALQVAAPWLGVMSPGDDALLDLPHDETTLDAALQRSIDRLDEASYALVGVASLAEDGHPLSELAQVVGGLPRVLVAAGGLRDAGLADLQGDRLHVLPLVARMVRRRLAVEEREAWWAFLGGLQRSPEVLRPWRHELERAVRSARGEALLQVLLRHIQLLYVYGPRAGLLGDVEGALSRLEPPLEGCGQVVWCLALLGASRPGGVADRLMACVEQLPEPEWVARAYSLVALAATADGDLGRAEAAGAEGLARLDDVDDAALRVDLLLRGSLPLRRRRDPRGADLLARAGRMAEAEGFPERALAAAMSHAFDGPADPARLARLEQHLERARPAMGEVSWRLQLGYVALLLLELGELERGRDALYEALAGLTEERSENLRVRAGLVLVHFPEEARALVAPVRGRYRYRADLVRALTADPPALDSLDDEQAALARTWLQGDPLGDDPRIETVRRCLEAAPRP